MTTAVPRALEQFAETSQLNALRTIVGAGETLKKAIQEDLLPSGYPTDSLKAVLEQILDNIQETIRLWERQGKLLKTFEDHRNWIWNIKLICGI